MALYPQGAWLNTFDELASKATKITNYLSHIS